MARKIKARVKELKREPADSTRTSGGLLRKTAYFTIEEWEAIRQVAFEANVTYADVMRRAVQEYLGLKKLDQRRGPKPAR